MRVPSDRPIAVFTQGLSGSGKSYWSRRVLEGSVDVESLLWIDTDQWLESHPEYDPRNPSELYEWAAAQAHAAHRNALQERQSFFLDGTLSDPRNVRNIAAAKAAGYFTLLITVDVSLKLALGQNARRARHVPEDVIRAKARTMPTAILRGIEVADAGWIITRQDVTDPGTVEAWVSAR